jgi:hypothetical protein
LPRTEEDVERDLAVRYAMEIPLAELTNETFSAACDQAHLIVHRMYHW